MVRMNKKGQLAFMNIMVAIMVFITIVVLIEPLKEGIVIARDVSHLDCTNAANSIGIKATCILVDMWLFYFVGTALAMSFAALSAKVLPKRST